MQWQLHVPEGNTTKQSQSRRTPFVDTAQSSSRVWSPERGGAEGPAHPGEVLVSVADGLGEGWVVGEERVHAGAGAGEELVLLGGWRRLLLQRRWRQMHDNVLSQRVSLPMWEDG